jgi:hypothetical protein
MILDSSMKMTSVLDMNILGVVDATSQAIDPLECICLLGTLL